jgi:hypothetical protein
MLVRSMIEFSLSKPFWWDPVGFLNHGWNLDLYVSYYPDTIEQSKEWRHSCSPCQQKFKTRKSSSKVLVSVFWDKAGVLLVDYLEKGATITVKCYIAHLNKLKQQMVSNRWGRLLEIIVFLDNAVLHKAAISHQKREDLHFKFLNNQPTHLIWPF